MEATKLTINKETIEMANKPLTNKRRGELRMERLKDLATSGKLAMIKNRGDLAEAVGYTYKQRHTLGYQWVHYRIKKGDLQETLIGYTNGLPEYEYKLVGYEPIVKKTTKKNKAVEQVLADYDKLKQESIEQSMAKLTSPMVTFYKGDATILLEFMSEDGIANIIKDIMEN